MTTPERTLRVGIAGYGIVGQRRREFVDARPDMKTVAVCDQTLPGAGTFDDGVHHFKTYPELLTQD